MCVCGAPVRETTGKCLIGVSACNPVSVCVYVSEHGWQGDQLNHFPAETTHVNTVYFECLRHWFSTVMLIE